MSPSFLLALGRFVVDTLPDVVEAFAAAHPELDERKLVKVGGVLDKAVADAVARDAAVRHSER